MCTSIVHTTTSSVKSLECILIRGNFTALPLHELTTVRGLPSHKVLRLTYEKGFLRCFVFLFWGYEKIDPRSEKR